MSHSTLDKDCKCTVLVQRLPYIPIGRIELFFFFFWVDYHGLGRLKQQMWILHGSSFISNWSYKKQLKV